MNSEPRIPSLFIHENVERVFKSAIYRALMTSDFFPPQGSCVMRKSRSLEHQSNTKNIFSVWPPF